MDADLSRVKRAPQLDDYLFKNKRESRLHGSDKVFWPKNIIISLRNEDFIRRLLTISNDRPSDSLVRFVVNHATRLCAILATVFNKTRQLRKALEYFEENNFSDDNLSAEIKSGQSSKSYSALLTEKLQNLEGPRGSQAEADEDEEEEDDRLWTPINIRTFQQNQWKALVPIFSTEKPEYNFKMSAILPFLTKETNQNRKGAFSTVYKVSLEPNHFEDKEISTNVQPAYFALKEIQPPTFKEEQEVSEKWGNEATQLKTMNLRNKKHIVRFIAAFKRGEDVNDTSYYLLFEWADCGSLEDLWRSYPQSVSNPAMVRHAIAQLLGLSEALAATHQADIRHGDLKPQNILCFSGSSDCNFSTLKIGDWGLAKYHNVMTRLRQAAGQKTGNEWGTALYEAPEADPQFGRRILSRQYDVWSMGCILLEYIIWILYGYDGIENFRSEVRGYAKDNVPLYKVVQGHDGIGMKAEVHDVVIKWMRHLEKREVSCAPDTALGQILKLVRDHLIVVKFQPLSGESISPLARISTTPSSDPSKPTEIENEATVITPTYPTDENIIQFPNGKKTEKVELTITPSDNVVSRPVFRTESLSESIRMTSEKLKECLTKIYNVGDQGDDFWLRNAPRERPQQPPPTPIRRSYNDQQGFLTTVVRQPERTSLYPNKHLNSAMGQLSVQPVINNVRESI